MSLIEEYYELNESEEVSAMWKVLQIVFYACAACLGLWCGYTLAILRLRFDDRCYLFTEVNTPASDDEQIDQSNINWESDTWCDYYQFSMVSSFIVAIIWATFFLMCGKGGKLPQPWRIVWPSLIFNFVYFLIILSTAVKIQQGTDFFCSRHDLGKIIYKRPSTENCEPLKVLLKKDLHLTAVQLEIVVKTSWACAISWIILFFLSFFRIVFVVDFHMYKICVFKIDDTIHNRREEVLRITNYEEPKQLNLGKDERKRFNLFDINDDVVEDLEAGNKKKIKADKKSMRQNMNAANAAFYVMADIRMLNRENKRKKSPKTLDETFAKSKTRLGPELRKSIKIRSDANASTTSMSIAERIRRHHRGLHHEEDDEEDDENGLDSSYFPLRKPDLDDIHERSDSERDIPSGSAYPSTSLKLKKQI